MALHITEIKQKFIQRHEFFLNCWSGLFKASGPFESRAHCASAKKNCGRSFGVLVCYWVWEVYATQIMFDLILPGPID